LSDALSIELGFVGSLSGACAALVPPQAARNQSASAERPIPHVDPEYGYCEHGDCS